MSGIVGFNWDDRELVQRMASTIKHRGPDLNGFYNDAKLSLGHQNLVVSKEDRERQPICNEDRDIWLILDGRIYNHEEIKKKLNRNHRFRTQLDAEVVLHAYEDYGEDCLKLFNGMFAFCLYDYRQDKFFLARDRAGVKPLYYYFKDGKFIFASELKAILQHPVEKTIDVDAVRFYLHHGVVPCPKSIFTDVKKLAPAEKLVLQGHDLRVEKYWDINFSEKFTEPVDLVAQLLRQQFEQAISMRLKDDVPVGAFLSGGVDSSSVAGVLKKKFRPELKTFAVSFDYEKFDESKESRMMAELLGTEHHEVPFNGEVALSLIPDLVYYYDEPFADSSMLATHYGSKFAKKYVKVSFCGDGGDELFAGYPRYVWVKDVVLPNVTPKFFKNNIIPPIANTIGKIKFHPIFYKVSKHLNLITMEPYARYEHIVSFGDQKTIGEYSMLGSESYAELFKSYYVYPDLYDNLMNIDWHNELHDDGLVKVDRAAMGASLETRSPILDVNLVEFAAKIPSSYKVNNGDKKYVFKLAMKDILPMEIWKKKKHGFGVPVPEYFKKEMNSYVHDTLLSSNFHSKPYLNQNGVRKIVEAHEKGVSDYSAPIWLFLMLEEFLKKWA